MKFAYFSQASTCMSCLTSFLAPWKLWTPVFLTCWYTTSSGGKLCTGCIVVSQMGGFLLLKGTPTNANHEFSGCLCARFLVLRQCAQMCCTRLWSPSILHSPRWNGVQGTAVGSAGALYAFFSFCFDLFLYM